MLFIIQPLHYENNFIRVNPNICSTARPDDASEMSERASESLPCKQHGIITENTHICWPAECAVISAVPSRCRRSLVSVELSLSLQLSRTKEPSPPVKAFHASVRDTAGKSASVETRTLPRSEVFACELKEPRKSSVRPAQK